MRVRVPFAGLLLMWCGDAALAVQTDHFTIGSAQAERFGVHEIVLTGNGQAANPFDTPVVVTFIPPSGEKNAKKVSAFFDGGNTWRARVYLTEVGTWNWTTTCTTDANLDGKSGSFSCKQSTLRGRLLPHSKNPRHWITEDGHWFLNLNDTAYFLLCAHDGRKNRVTDDVVRQYVRDDTAQGITSVRCFLASRPEGFNESTDQWHAWYFPDRIHDRFHLESLQSADHRLRLLLNEFPDVAVQLILFPLEGYARDDRFWVALSPPQRERLLRNVTARFAAYPQLFWLITNDAHYGEKFPNNNAMAREVGAYLMQHDPWQHPRSTGHARRLPFYFGNEDWATYVHIEHAHDLGAAEYDKYHALGKPVFLGEDRYEQDHGPKQDPKQMRYWQRRLFWAWLLSGGSANYGGRWSVVHPYRETGAHAFHMHNVDFRSALCGLDSVAHIRDYFVKRNIDLADYEADQARVRDPDGGKGAHAPKLMRRGETEFLLYHPNAAADGQDAKVHAGRKARILLDLRKAVGLFRVEWYRVQDGVAQDAPPIAAGNEVELVAPWPGQDVVLRLTSKR